MIRRHFAGIFSAVAGMFGRDGGSKSVPRAPKSQAWMEPNPPKPGGRGKKRRSRKWWLKRKSRMRMAKESRRKNRS